MMAASWIDFNPPQPPQLTGNVTTNWQQFKQAFGFYSAVSGLEVKSAKIQSSTLLHMIGPEAIDVYNTCSLMTDTCSPRCNLEASFHTVQYLLTHFDNNCNPKKNCDN